MKNSQKCNKFSFYSVLFNKKIQENPFQVKYYKCNRFISFYNGFQNKYKKKNSKKSTKVAEVEKFVIPKQYETKHAN